MICPTAKYSHNPDVSQKKLKTQGPLSSRVQSLLSILRDQLLTQQFDDARRTMEGVMMAYDLVPGIARKIGIEMLIHDHRHYGEALQMFKHLLGKQLKHREEILLDLSLFIARHGNLEEAYETLHSQIFADPYKTNPLLRGYCGVYQYLLWEQEVKKHHQLKPEPNDTFDSADSALSSSEEGHIESVLAKAYAKCSLAHFDTLWTMSISAGDNLDYFLHTHCQLLLALDMGGKAVEVLLMYDEKFPGRIVVRRLLCSHYRQFSPAKVKRRRKCLRALVELDDSCSEVLELVQLMLEKEKVDYMACQELVLNYLDYPCNGENQLAWDLLKKIHSSCADSLQSNAWLSRLPLWNEMYAENCLFQDFLVQ